MKESIPSLPTILLPSIKNGQKLPPVPIATIHFGVSEALMSLLVSRAMAGHVPVYYVEEVKPNNNIFAGYGTLYSDYTIRDIVWLTFGLAGTLYD